MKRLFFLLSSFVLAFMFVACDSGNTGDFKIKLKLPIDYEAICSEYDDPGNDYTYCINSDDQTARLSMLIQSGTITAAKPSSSDRSKKELTTAFSLKLPIQTRNLNSPAASRVFIMMTPKITM